MSSAENTDNDSSSDAESSDGSDSDKEHSHAHEEKKGHKKASAANVTPMQGSQGAPGAGPRRGSLRPRSESVDADKLPAAAAAAAAASASPASAAAAAANNAQAPKGARLKLRSNNAVALKVQKTFVEMLLDVLLQIRAAKINSAAIAEAASMGVPTPPTTQVH